MAGLSPLNRALTKIPARAEKRDALELRETFVDSGVAEQLDKVDHQVLYGRRGTGKTHAVSYLAAEARSRGDVALNIDLRMVGSPDGVLDSGSASLTQRATRLMVDMLGQVRDGLFEAVLEDEDLIQDAAFVDKLDGLLAAITNVEVIGDVELSVEAERRDSVKNGGSFKAALTPKPTFEAQVTAESSQEGRDLLRETRRGSEKLKLNFSDVARALRELARTLVSRRIWLILDEWSSVPRDIQPYLADFLRRCVMPLQRFTVKITAIEQQSTFRTMSADGSMIGFELGADIGANLALDDFMVFEKNEDHARDFFANLFFKHLTSGTDNTFRVDGLTRPADFIKMGFTAPRVFDELVRAAEGVPRDAIYIAEHAAMQARDRKISMPLIHDSARNWYQTDKARALRTHAQSDLLLKWIIENVIRKKKARGFLVNESNADDRILLSLFDARVLHIIRRGYSAQDHPGERFEVWGIDYGAYVDYHSTGYFPKGLLPFDDPTGETEYVDIDVPVQDLRAIRRAILNLEDFYASHPEVSQARRSQPSVV